MPFKSKAQRRKFAALLVEGEITPEAYERWNRETGRKELPERVKQKGVARRKSAGRKRRGTTKKATKRTRAATRKGTATRKRTAPRKRTSSRKR